MEWSSELELWCSPARDHFQDVCALFEHSESDHVLGVAKVYFTKLGLD